MLIALTHNLLQHGDNTCMMSQVSISNAIHGFGRMSDKSVEVTNLLGVIVKNMYLSKTISSSTGENVSEIWEPDSISYALRGLKEMTGRAVETRAMLALISSKIIVTTSVDGENNSDLQQKQQFQRSHFGHSFYGLQSMICNAQSIPEVSMIISKLVKKLELFHGTLSPRDIALILFSLHMTKDTNLTDELKDLIIIVTKHINNSNEIFTSQQLG